MTEGADLPEYYPTVVMDIRLGRKYSSIDFDYDAYVEECQIQNISLEDAGTLTIALEKSSYRHHGNFTPTDLRVRLDANRSMNKYMSHELSHASDWFKKGRETNAAYELCRDGMTMGMYLGAAAIVMTNANRMLELGINNEALVRTDFGILAALGIFTLGYSLSGDERKALKATWQSDKQIITAVKR